jgi:phage baseplate assembly protein W
VNDVFHTWGADLVIGATGDLSLASGSVVGQQRVLRRLLTNPGDYIWQLNYGAGLASFIGQPARTSQIQAVIRGQIFKESAVARTPEPLIDVQVSPGGASGTVYAYLRYVDSTSGQTQILNCTVGK